MIVGMKWSFALAFLVFLTLLPGARGQGSDEQYVQIFARIQEADSLSTNQPGKALAKYVEAQNALQHLHKASPDWNPKIVSFRLTYLASRISALSGNSPLEPPAPTPSTNSAVPQPANPPTPQSTPASDLAAQVRALNDQVRQLQAERIVMEAKLKEALALQPAEADPRELARTEEKLKALQKENELLKVSLESEKPKPGAATDPKTLEQTQKALADTNRKLTQAQTEIASLQSDKDLLRLEKGALEGRLKQLTTNPAASSAPPPIAPPDSPSRVRQLEGERDDLQKKLAAANKALAARKNGNAAASHVQQLELELAGARARLEVFEARQVPYAAEELALMKAPDTKLAAVPPKTTKRPMKDLPAGSSKLVSEAQAWFASRQYEKAEAAYAQVVRMDPKNVPALGNLAAIQVEAGHLEEADKNIQLALAEDPEDAYSLYVLGILRFRQAKFDDAFTALSRAVKLDPDNPEIHNYLGLTLSEKGMRAPAETELRRAIQLQPTYGAAHYNLAMVYLYQQPPAVELARWHYQKALAAGHASNPEVDKRLGSK
jgi:tetratricopeptide (TPR) repeat protein